MATMCRMERKKRKTERGVKDNEKGKGLRARGVVWELRVVCTEVTGLSRERRREQVGFQGVIMRMRD